MTTLILATILHVTSAYFITGSTISPQRMWNPEKGVVGVPGTGLAHLNKGIIHLSGVHTGFAHSNKEGTGLAPSNARGSGLSYSTTEEVGVAHLTNPGMRLTYLTGGGTGLDTLNDGRMDIANSSKEDINVVSLNQEKPRTLDLKQDTTKMSHSDEKYESFIKPTQFQRGLADSEDHTVMAHSTKIQVELPDINGKQTELVQIRKGQRRFADLNGKETGLADTNESVSGVADLNKDGSRLAKLGMVNFTVASQTAQQGSTVFLHCLVQDGADKHVSWVRRRDFQLLTSGRRTYSRDQRFDMARTGNNETWTLVIKYVQKRDQGVYECQVSTRTGRHGHLVDLHVVVPEAVIDGTPERHVQAGSTLTLTCSVRGSMTPPEYILWHHDSRILNYGWSEGDIVVVRESRPPASSSSTSSSTPTSSIMTLARLAPHHSGNYTCTAPHASPAAVTVFVSRGDKTAAIQRYGSSGHNISPGVTLYYLTLLLLLMLLSSWRRGLL